MKINVKCRNVIISHFIKDYIWTNLRCKMRAVGIVSVLLSVVNYADFVPLYPGSRPGSWAKFYKPIELKPSSWDSKPLGLSQGATPSQSNWDSFGPGMRQTSRTAMDIYPTTQVPRVDLNPRGPPGLAGGFRLDSVKLYTPVELLPANQDLGITTAMPTGPGPTKAPEHDHWVPEFSIRLRPKSDHKLGPPNATVFVHGEGFMAPINQQDFMGPSFDPLTLLQTVTAEAPQPLKLQVVREAPYFIFFAPDFQKNGRFKRSLGHRTKRHHPTILQSVLGELQNYALVPIQSNNGKTSYILLKNPKFVIGATVLNPSPTAASQIPTVIQLANPAPSPKIVYNPGVIHTSVRPTYQSAVSPTRDHHWTGPAVGGHTVSHDLSVVQPVPTATSVDYQLAGQYNPPMEPVHVNINNRARSGIRQRQPIYGRLGEQNVMMTADIASQTGISPQAIAPTSAVGPVGTGSDQVHKTEVVETVVETQQQQAAVATNDVASANTASQASSVGSGVTGTGAAGVITETGTAASQTAAAASSTKMKQAKKVVTKKTTTTKIKGDGTGGAMKEVSQVLEQSVHNDAAVAKAETAVASTAVSSGSNAVVMDVPPAIAGSAGAASDAASSSAAASSSSAASATNSSVKSVKTIRKTTVTKTKVAAPSGAAVVADPVPTAILSDKASQGKAKTAILSENNDVRAANKQAALIATESPRRAAKVVRRRKRPQRRRKQKKRKTTTKRPSTTVEMELEMEEVMSTTTIDPYGPTVTPTAPYYGFTPPNTATQAPSGVAGWAGPTTEPALGPLDRINTTDVPEEIEARPDKTPAEKRAELRKLARERARKAGRSKTGQKVAKQPVKQHVANQQPSKTKPKTRKLNTRNNRVGTSQGPTTVPPTTPYVTDPVPITKGPQRKPPPRGRHQRRRLRGRRRNRGNTPPTNNRANGRVLDGEERLPIRDPFTRWIYNNVETEVLEKVLPFLMLG